MKSLLIDAHSAFALLIALAATALVVFGKLTADQWVATVEWIYTAYLGGHVVMNTATTLTTKSSLPAATVNQPSSHA